MKKRKPLVVTKADPDVLFRIPTILHLEAGGVVTFPGKGSCELDPISEKLFSCSPTKGKPSYHRYATKALEALYIVSGSPLSTC